MSDLHALQKILAIPTKDLIELLGMSESTYQRRKTSDQPLSDKFSELLKRYTELAHLAIEVFETPEPARLWLTSPQYALGEAIPLDYARTKSGAHEVKSLLHRSEHSVYS